MTLTRVQLVLGGEYLTAVVVVYFVQRMLTWFERFLRPRMPQTRLRVGWSHGATRQCSSSLPAEGPSAPTARTVGRGHDGNSQVMDRRALSVAFTRVAVLFSGVAVTGAGAAIVPVWGNALLIAGLPICIAGGVRLLDGRSIVVQYGCGPFLGVMLFSAVFSIAETPAAAARRAPTAFIQAQDGRYE